MYMKKSSHVLYSKIEEKRLVLRFEKIENTWLLKNTFLIVINC